MYNNKQQDHEKRKNQEGSYSLYNYLYHYLLDNFEPENLRSITTRNSVVNLLIKEGKAYCIKGGRQINDSEIKDNVNAAIKNFCLNNGKHGDTAKNLGKQQDNSFNTIKETISDLRW